MAGTPAATFAVSMHGLTVTGDGGREILRGIDWSLPYAASAIVVGASGSGKSHVLRVINRLTERSAGDLEILGKPVDAWPVGELRRTVGWVPQRPMLQAGTVADVLAVPRKLGLISAANHDQRLPVVVAAVQLAEELLDRNISLLSGGERHRVAIARALLLEPKILLLDEPSGALDGNSAARLLESLQAWAKQREASLIIVSHRIEDVQTLGGTLVVMDEGRVVREGDAATLLDDPTEYDVRQLLTGTATDAGQG